jgi:hypothetical protein
MGSPQAQIGFELILERVPMINMVPRSMPFLTDWRQILTPNLRGLL